MEVPSLFSVRIVLKKRGNMLCEELSELFFRRCRLAYFEIKDKVYTQQQLVDVTTEHYIGQVNKCITLINRCDESGFDSLCYYLFCSSLCLSVSDSVKHFWCTPQFTYLKISGRSLSVLAFCGLY